MTHSIAGLPKGTFCRRQTVERGRKIRDVVYGVKRTKYINEKVVDLMQEGVERDMMVYFVPLPALMPRVVVLGKISPLGLKMIDPVAMCDINESEPLITGGYPNIALWEAGDNLRIYMCFQWEDVHRGHTIRSDYYSGPSIYSVGFKPKWYYVCVPA